MLGILFICSCYFVCFVLALIRNADSFSSWGLMQEFVLASRSCSCNLLWHAVQKSLISCMTDAIGMLL